MRYRHGPSDSGLSPVRRIPLIRFCCLCVLCLSFAVAPASAAEVLQVRSGSLLQVGDGNRTYTVELACVSVEEDQQTEAIDWLRQQLPRRRRVNLRPVGSSNGQLVARVTPLGEENDVNTGLIAAGLATDGCAAELG